MISPRPIDNGASYSTEPIDGQPVCESHSIDVKNDIPRLQNEDRALQLLAAQRQLYARAKRLLGLQLLLVGPVTTLIVVFSIYEPSLRAHAIAWGVTIFVLDASWLVPAQRRLRESAARVQERFDCDVLSLRWDTTKVGNPEPNESVHEQAQHYQVWASTMPPLEGWYPESVQRLPLTLARIVCQRTNCWWDAKQRRSYAAVMAGWVLLSALAVVWIGGVARLTIPDLMLFVVLPLLPTLRLAHQQWDEHRSAADRLDRLREHAERLWRIAISNPSDPNLEQEARTLQGEIFDGRKRNPPVFDFIFKRLRDRQEAQMNTGAEQLVHEAEQRIRVLGQTP